MYKRNWRVYKCASCGQLKASPDGKTLPVSWTGSTTWLGDCWCILCSIRLRYQKTANSIQSRLPTIDDENGDNGTVELGREWLYGKRKGENNGMQNQKAQDTQDTQGEETQEEEVL